MKKFMVLFLAPQSLMAEWMQKPEAERKEAEDKMRKEWDEWTASHSSLFVDGPAGTGKTKSVSESGVADTKNDIMLYGIIEANSQDEAANMFVGHPHFGIPQATIEVMEINPIRPM
jgi:hypothetical protein